MGPFLSALLDFWINGQRLKTYHIVGMTFMVTCAALVSLSKLFDEPSETTVADMPIYIALLMSLVMPITCAFFGVLGRYVTVTRGKNARDWSFGYSLIQSAIFVLAGAIAFS